MLHKQHPSPLQQVSFSSLYRMHAERQEDVVLNEAIRLESTANLNSHSGIHSFPNARCNAYMSDAFFLTISVIWVRVEQAGTQNPYQLSNLEISKQFNKLASHHGCSHDQDVLSRSK